MKNSRIININKEKNKRDNKIVIPDVLEDEKESLMEKNCY